MSLPPVVAPPQPERPTRVRAVVIDPAARTIDEGDMAATVPALEALVGAPPVEFFRAPGGNIYGDKFVRRNASLWRKEDIALPGRCVIVGVSNDHTYMIDATISLDNLRRTIHFNDYGSRDWVRYGPGPASD
jgi:hypothetical protein